MVGTKWKSIDLSRICAISILKKRKKNKAVVKFDHRDRCVKTLRSRSIFNWRSSFNQSRRSGWLRSDFPMWHDIRVGRLKYQWLMGIICGTILKSGKKFQLRNWRKIAFETAAHVCESAFMPKRNYNLCPDVWNFGNLIDVQYWIRLLSVRKYGTHKPENVSLEYAALRTYLCSQPGNIEVSHIDRVISLWSRVPCHWIFRWSSHKNRGQELWLFRQTQIPSLELPVAWRTYTSISKWGSDAYSPITLWRVGANLVVDCTGVSAARNNPWNGATVGTIPNRRGPHPLNFSLDPLDA